MTARRRLVAAAVLLAAVSCAHAEADRAWGVQLAGSYAAPNNDRFSFQGTARYQHLEEVYLTYHRGGFYFQGSALQERVEGFPFARESTINELYLDSSLGDWDVTIGKKRLAWGVGFGFRPLDVIGREPRRVLLPTLLEGLPLVALERYTGTLALTLLCGNDFHWNNGDGFERGDDECAARYYGLVNDWELQLVAHRHPDVHYQAGFAVARVENNYLEWHASLLYQHEYRKWTNTLTEQPGAVLAGGDPMVSRRFHHGMKGVVGATYTWLSGHSLLFEYWYDEAAYSGDEWNALRSVLDSQRQLFGSRLETGTRAQISAATGFLNEPNVLQHNVLLRWSYNGERRDPALDVLVTPGDGGAVLTASLETDLSGTYRLDYGARYYFGAAGSVYRALPDRYRLYVSLRGAFNW